MNISLDKINSYLSAYNKPVSIEGGFESNDGSDLLIADILEDEKQMYTQTLNTKT